MVNFGLTHAPSGGDALSIYARININNPSRLRYVRNLDLRHEGAFLAVLILRPLFRFEFAALNIWPMNHVSEDRNEHLNVVVAGMSSTLPSEGRQSLSSMCSSRCLCLYRCPETLWHGYGFYPNRCAFCSLVERPARISPGGQTPGGARAADARSQGVGTLGKVELRRVPAASAGHKPVVPQREDEGEGVASASIVVATFCGVASWLKW